MKPVKTKKLIAIVGPTASGKTSLGIELCKQFTGEVINGDSRQIFTGMDIGTDKPPLHDGDSDGVPHHLFDIAEPKELLSVVEFQQKALSVIKKIHERDALPFLVGGSGYYVRAITENLQFPEVPDNPELRKTLESFSAEDLYQKLRIIDIDTADSIDPKNKQRVIRAIEISSAVGTRTKLESEPLFDTMILGISGNKETLEKNISSRIEMMFSSGLEEEVHSLVDKYGWTPVLESTIDYAEFKEYFNKALSLDELKTLLVKNHLALVKKQNTWFKAQKNIVWIDDTNHAHELVRDFIT